VENFTLFLAHKAGLVKNPGTEPQFLGSQCHSATVKRVLPVMGSGVFWQTQGSGKSYSWVFYARKSFGNFRATGRL